MPCPSSKCFNNTFTHHTPRGRRWLPPPLGHAHGRRDAVTATVESSGRLWDSRGYAERSTHLGRRRSATAIRPPPPPPPRRLAASWLLLTATAAAE